MSRKSFLAALVAVIISLSGPAMAQRILDEQYGPGGSKVQLVKARVRNGVLTLAVRYIHPWEAATQEERRNMRTSRKVELQARTIPIKFKVSSVFYIADGKRYYVLKDKEGRWLASPVAGDYIAESMDQEPLAKRSKQGKIPALLLDKDHPVKVLWFKFPAPPEGVDEIEFQVPEVAPFDVELGQ